MEEIIANFCYRILFAQEDCLLLSYIKKELLFLLEEDTLLNEIIYSIIR